jgi:hypothetical protein
MQTSEFWPHYTLGQLLLESQLLEQPACDPLCTPGLPFCTDGAAFAAGMSVAAHRHLARSLLLLLIPLPLVDSSSAPAALPVAAGEAIWLANIYFSKACRWSVGNILAAATTTYM